MSADFPFPLDGEPTTYKAALELKRAWLREHRDEYMLAKIRRDKDADVPERLAGFEEARKLCLEAPHPKDGEEAIYRLGYLRRVFESATKTERTVLRWEAEQKALIALEKAAKDSSRTGRTWFLDRP